MQDLPPEGPIAETPFPRLLFDLWTRERTGRLILRRNGEERVLFFDKGRLLVTRESFSEAGFLDALVRKKVLAPEQARQCQHLAELKNISLVKALGELGLLSPIPLWNLLESFFARRLFPLFDWDEGTYEFDPAAEIPPRTKLGQIEVPSLILQGIRQMHEERIADRFLPGPDEAVRVSAPYFLHRLEFEPYERYALNILGESPNLGVFLAASELGTRENRKVLFAFACLGILGSAERLERTRPAPESPEIEPARVLNALNEKCAFVYRYVSKEAGPIAQTILSKSLEEVKPALGALFQKTELLDDGRIEVDPALRLGANHLPEELVRQLARGYDEILMAEVIAVKKALGTAHESALVRNLEKVGCA